MTTDDQRAHILKTLQRASGEPLTDEAIHLGLDAVWPGAQTLSHVRALIGGLEAEGLVTCAVQPVLRRRRTILTTAGTLAAQTL